MFSSARTIFEQQNSAPRKDIATTTPQNLKDSDAENLTPYTPTTNPMNNHSLSFMQASHLQPQTNGTITDTATPVFQSFEELERWYESSAASTTDLDNCSFRIHPSRLPLHPAYCKLQQDLSIFKPSSVTGLIDYDSYLEDISEYDNRPLTIAEIDAIMGYGVDGFERKRPVRYTTSDSDSNPNSILFTPKFCRKQLLEKQRKNGNKRLYFYTTAVTNNLVNNYNGNSVDNKGEEKKQYNPIYVSQPKLNKKKMAATPLKAISTAIASPSKGKLEKDTLVLTPATERPKTTRKRTAKKNTTAGEIQETELPSNTNNHISHKFQEQQLTPTQPLQHFKKVNRVVHPHSHHILDAISKKNGAFPLFYPFRNTVSGHNSGEHESVRVNDENAENQPNNRDNGISNIKSVHGPYIHCRRALLIPFTEQLSSFEQQLAYSSSHTQSSVDSNHDRLFMNQPFYMVCQFLSQSPISNINTSEQTNVCIPCLSPLQHDIILSTLPCCTPFTYHSIKSHIFGIVEQNNITTSSYFDPHEQFTVITELIQDQLYLSLLAQFHANNITNNTESMMIMNNEMQDNSIYNDIQQQLGITAQIMHITEHDEQSHLNSFVICHPRPIRKPVNNFPFLHQPVDFSDLITVADSSQPAILPFFSHSASILQNLPENLDQTHTLSPQTLQTDAQMITQAIENISRITKATIHTSVQISMHDLHDVMNLSYQWKSVYNSLCDKISSICGNINASDE